MALIHAWKGSMYYPKGPISDYIGTFESEDSARLGIGIVEESQWAMLMIPDDSGKLIGLRIWDNDVFEDPPTGWRDVSEEDTR